jgi:hypothetical protein
MSVSSLRLLGLIVLSACLAAGCSSAKKIEVGGTCILNSDCNSPLVCTAGKCHDACHTSADCPAGQSCITASDQSTVCQLPVETHCIYDSDCPTGLKCATDQRCRNQCQGDVDCFPGQICTTTQTCAEPNQVDSNNNLLLPDGGVRGSGGASGIVDAAICPAGTEACACYPNDTCNAGLTCASHLCVSLGAGGSGGDSGCPTGAELCPCYANDTCNTGLTCASHLCVSLGAGGASGAGGSADAGRKDGGADLGGGSADAPSGNIADVAGTDGTTGGQPFSLLVAEGIPGPTIPQSQWNGVLQFKLTGDGAPLVSAAGIDKSQVADPCGLAFRAASSEVFVGNRHGGTAADGVTGSISRFTYDRATGTLTPNGTITGNGLYVNCQVAFHPVTGELFAANVNYANGAFLTGNPALSRFTFDGAGNAIPNGTLGTGNVSAMAIAPDGKTVYTTDGASSVIQQYDLASGNVSTGVTISAAPRFLYLAALNSYLYATSLDVNKVYRLSIDSSDHLTLKDSFATSDGPYGVAFSPDGQEMFIAAGYWTTDAHLIDRYQYNSLADSWAATTQVTISSSPQGILVVP